MPSKYEDALSALEAERDGLQARVAEVNAAIDALRAVTQAAAPAAPAKARRGPGRPPGRPRKAAVAAPTAPKRGAAKAAAKAAAKKPAGRRGRKPRGAAKKPAGPKLEPRIEEYFASNPKRQSTAQEIGAALGVDQRAVRLSLGRMAKKNKATRLDDGSYRAYSG